MEDLIEELRAELEAERAHRMRETIRADRERTLRLAVEQERDAILANPDRCPDCGAEYQAVREELEAALAEAAAHNVAATQYEKDIEQLREQLRKAEHFNKYLLGETVYTVMQVTPDEGAKAIVEALMDSLCEPWFNLTDEQMALCHRVLPERLPRAVLYMGELNEARAAAYDAGWRQALWHVAIGLEWRSRLSLRGVAFSQYAVIEALAGLGDEHAVKMVGGGW